MIWADFHLVAAWWLTYFLVSLVCLPSTILLFHKFWDRGYIFSKVIAPVILSYLTLILGIFKVLSFSSLTLFGLLTSLFFLNLALVLKTGLKKFLQILNQHKWVFIFEEVLFFIILAAWSYVRGFSPDIEGLEKYMDWGFVNSILRSDYGPPSDMWFAGLPINYYYFGHYIIAVITKLSAIPSTYTYNLAIASTCALTFTAGFSLASNLIAKINSKINLKLIIIGGLLSATLLSFGGNLHSVYKIGKNIIQNEGYLKLTQDSIKKAADSYWYPDATRFIGFDPDVQDKTIHEFPLYSFTVADLHGHMNGIPVVILIVTVLLLAFYEPIFIPLPLGFLLSIAYMTNAWDFAIYGLLFGISTFVITRNVYKTVGNGLLTIIFWYLFTLPFSLHFTPMAEGLRLSDSHTPFYQLFVLYGGFWLISLPFAAFAVKNFKNKLKTVDYFVLSIIITATVLIIIPEIGYIKDIYIYEHRRANTMFKLVYQAFILYSLTAGYCLIRLKKYLPYKLLFALVFVIHLIYPFFAVKSFYGLTNYRGLYGLNYLKNLYPDNFEAISWLNQHVTGQPHIVEAVGDSYTTFDQFSVSTGLPTVQGWVVHEWLWRGGYDKPAARQTDVQSIYESTDLNVVKSLLQKYSVEYIILGDKEYEKYPTIDHTRFQALGAKLVFESGKTRIYQYQ